MPRFVILHHELPSDHQRPSHWDFMIEVGDALRTWALAGEPRASAAIDAESLTDHRLAYLTYEGPISGNRGRVTRWDEGTYKLLEESAEVLWLRLDGRKCRGVVALAKAATAEEPQRWLVSFVKS